MKQKGQDGFLNCERPCGEISNLGTNREQRRVSTFSFQNVPKFCSKSCIVCVYILPSYFHRSIGIMRNEPAINSFDYSAAVRQALNCVQSKKISVSEEYAFLIKSKTGQGTFFTPHSHPILNLVGPQWLGDRSVLFRQSRSSAFSGLVRIHRRRRICCVFNNKR